MKRKPPQLDKPYPRHRPVAEGEAELWQVTMGEKPSPPLEKKREGMGRLPAQKQAVVPRLDHPLFKEKKKAPAPAAVIDKPTHIKLRKGKLATQATLDLHGYTRVTAHKAVIDFINESQARAFKLVLIITGKSGILRDELPRWLQESPLRGMVTAYDKAGPRHGADGAWYLRIRKTKP